MSKRLNEKLIDIEAEGLYPFHMPGHKRNILDHSDLDSFGKKLEKVYNIDITEIDGFDNLHDAKEIIKEAEEKAAVLYGSDETHFLVNGATSGILSAITALTTKGDKVITARNSHISVYNAIELNELNPVYIEPDIVGKAFIKDGIQGSISVSAIKNAIQNNKDAKAVIITSPTYDGVLSDVFSICEIAHSYNIPVIVDEAHGALLYIDKRSAVLANADIVINSVHKTLPSLTQTAIIHINGNIVNRDRVRKYLRVFQTSSPSYILMGSIDYAIQVMEKDGKDLYHDFCIRLNGFNESVDGLKNLVCLNKKKLLQDEIFDFDDSKILISAKGIISGKDLYDILRNRYSLQPEMAAGDYVLLMGTIFDTDEGIDRLKNALYEIDNLVSIKDSSLFCEISSNDNDEASITNEKQIEKLKNRLSKESPYTVYVYPPGIPIIVENEIVTEDKINKIENAAKSKLDIKWIS